MYKDVTVIVSYETLESRLNYCLIMIIKDSSHDLDYIVSFF